MTTFAERLTALMEQQNRKISDLQKALGVTYEMARRYTLGMATPRDEKIEIMAKYLDVSPAYLKYGTIESETTKEKQIDNITSNVKEIGTFDLWDRHTPMNDDEYAVPFYQDIRFAAGNGFADDIADYNNFKLRFSKATLRRQGVQYENAVCVVADGNSMEPVIPDGSTVGVDLGNKTIRDGKIYAINHGGLLRIKLLYNMPNNQVRIRSYNSEEYDDEIADLQDISVLGKVFWYSVLL
ncbi:LexA family transcriptional regulator [Rodentibacter genomosp. 2]|uniref:Transcriptional regulator n=1 Tax=Rodentibacter genomosp. 2 TaxID=1908266 RepID=A0A1V3JN91_9PAST|nr:helix-turn-helix transcriptional regulator [Rodentibacter genomosp. 2]OOF58306.1 transcriptional regulator [Rodentibacter genomosp. 2]